MLYTKAAALRLLSGLATVVHAVRQLKNCIQVTYQTRRGKCSTFLSRKAFKQAFVDARKASGRSLPSSQINATHYQVGEHTVVLSRDRLDCDCHDYMRQRQVFGRGCCKHGYHVLQAWLSQGSLAEYLQCRRNIA
jgi:hypothetical protein